ncbi:hypothetical protein [Haloferax sp. DFSO60]|uniref:hypothetical protein n=1 Tax=Haloferax sp. DFSO60 TaxID=3388652 RepID=UPI00397ABC6A
MASCPFELKRFLGKLPWRYSILLVLALSTTLTAGCLSTESPDQPWKLWVNGNFEQHEGVDTFTGDVTLNGMYQRLDGIHDVRVRFVDENNETMRVVSYGTINGSHRRESVNESFDRPPKYALVYVGEVQYNGTEGIIYGCKRAERRYCDRYFDYDPLADLNATVESR